MKTGDLRTDPMKTGATKKTGSMRTDPMYDHVEKTETDFVNTGWEDPVFDSNIQYEDDYELFDDESVAADKKQRALDYRKAFDVLVDETDKAFIKLAISESPSTRQYMKNNRLREDDYYKIKKSLKKLKYKARIYENWLFARWFQG